MARFHRTTLSIPAELYARMRAVNVKVNWSALAARAFAAKLAEIEAELADIQAARDAVLFVAPPTEDEPCFVVYA